MKPLFEIYSEKKRARVLRARRILVKNMLNETIFLRQTILKNNKSSPVYSEDLDCSEEYLEKLLNELER